MNAREVIRLLEKDGWFLKRTRGSHRVYKHSLKKGSVVIAGHASKDIPIGTLKDIFYQAGLDDRDK